MVQDNNLRLHCFHGDGTEKQEMDQDTEILSCYMETLTCINVHMYCNLGFDTLCSLKCKITLFTMTETNGVKTIDFSDS